MAAIVLAAKRRRPARLLPFYGWFVGRGLDPPCNWVVAQGCTGGYGIRPYGEPRVVWLRMVARGVGDAAPYIHFFVSNQPIRLRQHKASLV